MKKQLLLFILALLCVPLAHGQSFQNPLQGPITSTSAACAVAGDQSCVWQKLSATASVATVQVSGTFSATLTVEANNGGANFTTLGTITTAGTTSYVVAGFTDFRVRASAYTSGTAFTTINSSTAPSGGVTSGTADPTGNACAANALYVRTTNGALYSCNAGVFAIVSSGGTGTVTSVSFTGGLVSVATPTTTPAFTVAGTSGGIVYFPNNSTWASSAAGTVNTLMKWGGAGNPPTASGVTDDGTTVSSPRLVNFSGTGAASTSPFLFNGTCFLAGTGTTNFPCFYMDLGASKPTSFSTGGVLSGINAPSGFLGNFVEYHLNGAATVFSVSQTGAISTLSTLSAVGVIQGSKVQTSTNCSSSASPAVCAAASGGSVAIPAGAAQTLQVNTTAVTANSQIFLTIDESLGTKLSVTCNTTVATLTQPVVTARTAATSFTIQEPATTATNPVCVSYLVVN